MMSIDARRPNEVDLGQVLRQAARDAAPRVLSMQAWAEGRSAHGSFDREYWSYRTSRGFVSATWQSAALGLAYIARDAAHDADRRSLHARATAGFRFWLDHRHRAGAVDEWFYGERSYCATAFGLQTICEFLLLDDCPIPQVERIEWAHRLRPSARWLDSRWNVRAANQNAASVAGRWLLSVLLDGDGRVDADRAMSRLSSELRPDGSPNEYGGADFGYALLTLDSLAVADRHGCSAAGVAAGGVLAFLRGLASSSGDLPWLLGSRTTAHGACAGLVHFARTDASAQWFLSHWSRDPERVVSRLTACDDRYFAYFGFPALARASRWWLDSPPLARKSTGLPDPAIKPSSDESPFQRWSAPRAVVWNSATDAIAIEDRSGRYWHHPGYEVEIGGRTYSTWHVERCIDKRLIVVADGRPLHDHPLLAPLVLVVARVAAIGSLVASFARLRTARPHRRAELRLERRVTVDQSTVAVTDSLVGSDLGDVTATRLARIAPFHSPSAHWHADSSIGNEPPAHPSWTRPLGRGAATVELSWTYDFEDDVVRYE